MYDTHWQEGPLLRRVFTSHNLRIYLLKVNIKTPKQGVIYVQSWQVQRRQWRRFGVFIVNFEYISHLVLVLV